MLQKTYDWTLRLSSHRHALAALALISFLESSVFPIPPDVLIIPMILANRHAAWRIAAVATVASLLGGMFRYGIGHFLFQQLGQPILEFYGAMDQFAAFQDMYRDWGAWIVGGAGLTPFPYKVITITSGVMALDPWLFALVSTLARGLRFFAAAALLWYFGPTIRRFVEHNLKFLATLFLALLLGSYVVASYVM